MSNEHAEVMTWAEFYGRMARDMADNIEKGSVEYCETQARLLLGPNTARERRVLIRRRARLVRQGHADMFSYRGRTAVYMDTDSIMTGEP